MSFLKENSSCPENLRYCWFHNILTTYWKVLYPMVIRFFFRIHLGRSNISAVIQLFQAEVLQRPRTCPNNAGCVQADLWHLPRFDNHARNQRRATYLMETLRKGVGWVGLQNGKETIKRCTSNDYNKALYTMLLNSHLLIQQQTMCGKLWSSRKQGLPQLICSVLKTTSSTTMCNP